MFLHNFKKTFHKTETYLSNGEKREISMTDLPKFKTTLFLIPGLFKGFRPHEAAMLVSLMLPELASELHPELFNQSEDKVNLYKYPVTS